MENERKSCRRVEVEDMLHSAELVVRGEIMNLYVRCMDIYKKIGITHVI